MSWSTRYNSKSTDAVDDPWDCKICKTIFGEYILEKILSTSEVGPILALIAPIPLTIPRIINCV
jgi:hypothetical protein